MSKLNMPTFDDFMAEMSPDREQAWADAAAQTLAANLETYNQTTAIIAASRRLTLEMMRDYHQWLVGNLQQVSLYLVRK